MFSWLFCSEEKTIVLKNSYQTDPYASYIMSLGSHGLTSLGWSGARGIIEFIARVGDIVSYII